MWAADPVTASSLSYAVTALGNHLTVNTRVGSPFPTGEPRLTIHGTSEMSAIGRFTNVVAGGRRLTISIRIPVGTQIFERDWDILIVLDTRRSDPLATVADEYDFLHDRSAVWSQESTSGEWVAHTFDRKYAPASGGPRT